MSGIFISYRRQDSPGTAGRLADNLKAHFARSQIFRDIETIEPGVDFIDSIERALASCVVLLAVIGPRWVNATDKNGRRRLDDPHDYSRMEIAAALHRNVRIIPVLVDGAVMPEAAELPDNLKTLARRQAIELLDTRWEFDVQQLVATLTKIPGLQGRGPARAAATSSQPGTFWGGKKGLAIGLAGAAIVALLLVSRPWSTPAPVDLTPPAKKKSVVSESPRPDSAPDRALPPDVPLPENRPSSTKPAPTASGPARDQERAPPENTRRVNINGVWVDTFGNNYNLAHQNGRVSLRIMPNVFNSQAEGQGTWDGRTLIINYAFYIPSLGSSRGMANAEVSPDGQKISGTYVETATGATMPFLLHR